ncbi:MAG: alkaline shock response membrane anchor protein AmaP [Clostridia bacterium]|nr:alkaline shock response membrane anchor protein AmaP [Clostridia bacterium]
MKMKLFDRFILRFGAFLTLCAGGVSVAAGILLIGKDLGDGMVMTAIPYALIIAGAVAVIVSILNVVVVRKYASRRKAFVSQQTELGELRIAVSAIENLILKCVETHKEVKVQDMRIDNKRGAINVGLRVSMNSNVSIPHAVEQLQSQIKRYLAASSGIEVRDISVSVDNAVGDEAALPVEPLMTAAEAEKVDEKPAEKEKVPMHQRIFGRDPEKPEEEQVIEAEHIEPPVETAAEEAPAEPEAVEEAPAEPEAAEPVEEEPAAGEAAEPEYAEEQPAEEEQAEPEEEVKKDE